MDFSFYTDFFRNFFFSRLPGYFKKNDTYKDNTARGLLERYLEIYGTEIDDEIVPFIENYLDIVDVTRSDDKFLVHTAYTLGNPPNLYGNTADWYKILKYIVDLYKIKGTAKSYRLWFALWGLHANLVQYRPKEYFYDSDNLHDEDWTYDSGCPTCSFYEIFVNILTNDCGQGQVYTPLTEEILNLIALLISLNEPINAVLKDIVPTAFLCDTVQFCIGETVAISLTAANIIYDDSNLYDDNETYDDASPLSTNIRTSDCHSQSGDMDFGLLHCNSNEYLLFVNPFGVMDYKYYYYLYYWSIDNGVTYTQFGGHLSSQQVSQLPGWGSTAYLFKVEVFYTLTDLTPFATFFWNELLLFPFGRFIQYQLNNDGIWRILKRQGFGVNKICETDQVRFYQPNTDYLAHVQGPGGNPSWDLNDVTLSGSTLATGTYNILFESLNGEIDTDCEGAKIVDIEILNTPVISGSTSVCFGDSATLDAGSGYDTYLWSTGATTQTIVVSATGTYTCTVTKAGFNCSPLAVFNFTVKPAVPTLVILDDHNALCSTRTGNTFNGVPNGTIITLSVQGGVGGVGDLYDTVDFGSGPQNTPDFQINSGGVFPIIAYKDGCPSNTVVITVNAVDTSVTFTLSQISSSPCEWKLEITDARVDIPTLTVDVYDSTGLPTSYSGSAIITHSDAGGGPLTFVMTPQTDVNGCALVLLETCTC